MSYINNDLQNPSQKKKFFSRRWVKITGIVLIVLILAGGIFAWKAGNILNKVTTGSLFENIVHNIPGVKDELKGEEEGRINVLLLGMRGEGLSGGADLADTIILASVNTVENKFSMISIPRDLYVTVPGTQDQQKINAVYHYGEEKGKGQGMEDMKTIVSEVSGLPVHYAVSIDFAGFKQLVDAIDGVEITLDKPFEEAMQFNEPHVCDSFFTVPTGEFENKTVKYFSKETGTYKTRVVKSYPLCTAPEETLECGGDFSLPAGKQTLSGEQALCFVRSRVTSSDFERAKRQQMILKLMKEKMLSIGTLADFSKINGIFDALGNNVKTDMALWEMQSFYDVYKNMPSLEIYQRVLENNEEGLLYHPENGAAGYILLPIGDNYDRIHEMAKNIFNLGPQSDINPK